MEIVINIPDELYNKYVSVYLSRGNGKTITYNLLKAIKNGTPLPKGHGRIVDISPLEFKIGDEDAYGTEYSNVDFYYELIALPTIIEADKEG